jgi:WD40 repeat protein
MLTLSLEEDVVCLEEKTGKRHWTIKGVYRGGCVAMPRAGKFPRVLLTNINLSTDQTIRELQSDQWTLVDACTGSVAKTGPLEFDEDIVSMTFSMCGNWFVTGNRSGDVKIWDTKQGVLIRTMQHKETELIGAKISLSISLDATRIAGVSRNWGDIVVIWDTATGVIVHEHGMSPESADNLKGIDACEFSPKDPTYLAIVSSENHYNDPCVGELWDIKNMEQVLDDHGYGHTFEGRKFIKFSPDGTQLVTYGKSPCRGNAQILVVDVKKASNQLKLDPATRLVSDASFSGCGQTVISIASQWCDVWDASDGTLLNSMDMGKQITHFAWGRHVECDDLQQIDDLDSPSSPDGRNSSPPSDEYVDHFGALSV